MREEYKKMKEEAKRTTPSAEIDMTDTSQVGQTPLLEQMIQSIGGINKTLQELSKTVKRLDEKDKQKDEASKTTAQIIRENNIKDPNIVELLGSIVDEKNAPLNEKIEKQNEKFDTFTSTFNTVVPKTTQTIKSGTSCKEEDIKYIDERIQEKESLLNKQERKAESYMNKQVENKIKLEIDRGKRKNEIEKFGPIDKATKSTEYNAKIIDLDKQISECDSNISGMNESFRSVSDSIKSEIADLKQKRQEILDRYIMSEEEFQEIIRPLKEINLTGLGFKTTEVNQPTTSQQSIG